MTTRQINNSISIHGAYLQARPSNIRVTQARTRKGRLQFRKAGGGWIDAPADWELRDASTNNMAARFNW